MQEIAEGVFELELVDEGQGWPQNAVNVWLVRDVVVDAGIRPMTGLILQELSGSSVAAHALTHGHADHQGASHDICEHLQIPWFVPAHEADALEAGDLLKLVPDSALNRDIIERCGGPGHPVSRRLHEGDEVAGFVVLETPGHSPGHVSFWRECDRVLIVGDVISNRNFETGEIGLDEPLAVFTVDPARNRESIRRLAALDPLVTCFGHGPRVAGPEPLHALVARFDAPATPHR